MSQSPICQYAIGVNKEINLNKKQEIEEFSSNFNRKDYNEKNADAKQKKHSFKVNDLVFLNQTKISTH